MSTWKSEKLQEESLLRWQKLNDPRPRGFTYDLSDESGRIIYRPHRMETKSEAAQEIRQMNLEVDTLLNMAKQKVTYARLEDNMATHRKIGETLMKWKSEGLVRIHPSEVEELTIYQNHLHLVIEKQRVEAVNQVMSGEIDITDGTEAVRKQESDTRVKMGLPPIMHRGWER